MPMEYSNINGPEILLLRSEHCLLTDVIVSAVGGEEEYNKTGGCGAHTHTNTHTHTHRHTPGMTHVVTLSAAVLPVIAVWSSCHTACEHKAGRHGEIYSWTCEHVCV